MAIRRPSLRVLTLLFALSHLLGAPALSIADALLERAAATAVAHVEDATRDSCPPGHGADCGICRALSAVAARASGPEAPAAVVAQDVPPQRAAPGSSRVAGAGSLPRAPPA